MQREQTLSGMHILVVEDEPLIAMALEDILSSFGCDVVGPVATIDEGTRLIGKEAIDGAILDVNVAGSKVFPLADALAERSIPFAYVTGYGGAVLRQCDRGRPILQKPYRAETLLAIASGWRRH